MECRIGAVAPMYDRPRARMTGFAVYAPLRERLNFLGLLLLVLVAAGTFALRSLVKPLVAQVVDEQRRTHVILENSNDAFIGLNADGDDGLERRSRAHFRVDAR
jgi:hypothetical protein